MESKPFHFRIILTGILALILLAGSGLSPVRPVAASGLYKYLTYINLSEPAGVDMGQPFSLYGTVTEQGGSPVVNKNVSFTINGFKLGQARTDSSGVFERMFTDVLNAGTYSITASTTGTHSLEGATASTSLVITPAHVRVQTVPAIPGVSFQFNGQTIVSGSDGAADIQIGIAGTYQLTVLADQYQAAAQRIEFGRWLDDTYKPYRPVDVPANQVIQVGLNVFQKINVTFVDLQGYPVPPGRIKQFTIRSAQGDLFTFTDNQPHWIPSSRVVRFSRGLIVTPLQYSVIDVMVDGTNAVNQSQQRFFARPDETLNVSLILYSLSIRARDGLFGSSVGKSANLVYPDGHLINLPFDQNGLITVHGLARGNYTVQVMDAKGLRQVIPVSLSRSQTVEIKIPTDLDLIVFISLGLLSALGLLLFGRRRWLIAHLRGNPPAFQKTRTGGVKSENFQNVDTGSDSSKRESIQLSDPEFIRWL